MAGAESCAWTQRYLADSYFAERGQRREPSGRLGCELGALRRVQVDRNLGGKERKVYRHKYKKRVQQGLLTIFARKYRASVLTAPTHGMYYRP
jgi:hypothetical protein